jgi:hypothetical protein
MDRRPPAGPKISLYEQENGVFSATHGENAPATAKAMGGITEAYFWTYQVLAVFLTGEEDRLAIP